MEQEKSILDELEDECKAHFAGPLPEGSAYRGENIRKNYVVIRRAAAEWGAKWTAKRAGINTYLPAGDPLSNIKAEYVFEFSSFGQWVNNASGLFASYSREERIICLDRNGNGLTGGEDFMHCRDHDLFPVKCYRLIRTSEQGKPRHKTP